MRDRGAAHLHTTMLLDIPSELTLVITRRLGVRDRLALGSTCRAAAPLVINTAILEFKLEAKLLERRMAEAPGGAQPSTWAATLVKLRHGTNAFCAADPSARTKGHLLPLYQAACDQSSGSIHREESGVPHVHGTAGPPRAGSMLLPPGSGAHLLPVGLDPVLVSLGLSDAALCIEAWRSGRGIPQGLPHALRPLHSLKACLTVLDLSRAQQLQAITAAGLGALRVARLPPLVRVACFDGCGALTVLRPSRGCQWLLSLRLEGCRQLRSASFLDPPIADPPKAQAKANVSPAATTTTASAAIAAAVGSALCWQLTRLEELELGWCTRLDAVTLQHLVPRATALQSLGLRGLTVHGLIEACLAHAHGALRTSAANSMESGGGDLDLESGGGASGECSAHVPQAIRHMPLTLRALDLGFAAGVTSEAVVALVHSCPSLVRCNLRAAACISTEVYNEVSWWAGGCASRTCAAPSVRTRERRIHA